MSRGGNKIVTQSDMFANELERTFAKNLHKENVQSRRQYEAVPIDRINEIIGNKSRYTSVEEAVSDMRSRTGLATYLKMTEAERRDLAKTAQFATEPPMMSGSGIVPSDEAQLTTEPSIEVELGDDEESNKKMPKLCQEHPIIDSTIKNFIEDRHGNVHVHAVLDHIRRLFQQENIPSDEWEDRNLRTYINSLITAEKVNSHTGDSDYAGYDTLGRLDQSDQDQSQKEDAFAILTPAKDT
jgi:hypothetical protein